MDMLKPRQETPNLTVQLVNGDRWELSNQTPKNFTLIIFYRGLHCPKCEQYLKDLYQYLNKLTEIGVSVVAISSDTEGAAKETYKKWELDGLPLGYGCSIEEARNWGLFISKGIKEKEPNLFIEPGVFIIKTDGKLYASSIQTMPFARPPIREIFGAIKYITKERYPARGEA